MPGSMGWQFWVNSSDAFIDPAYKRRTEGIFNEVPMLPCYSNFERMKHLAIGTFAPWVDTHILSALSQRSFTLYLHSLFLVQQQTVPFPIFASRRQLLLSFETRTTSSGRTRQSLLDQLPTTLQNVLVVQAIASL